MRCQISWKRVRNSGHEPTYDYVGTIRLQTGQYYNIGRITECRVECSRKWYWYMLQTPLGFDSRNTLNEGLTFDTIDDAKVHCCGHIFDQMRTHQKMPNRRIRANRAGAFVS
jgi:hypothetical protein